MKTQRALKSLAVTCVSIGLLFGGERAQAGTFNGVPAPGLVFGGVVLLYGSVKAAEKPYQARCASGGGTFGVDGEFRSSGGSGRRFTMPCPDDAMSLPTSYFFGMTTELESSLEIFKNTDKLQANMKAAGKGVKPDGCDTHHVVPEADGKAKPGQQMSDTDVARDILRQCNVDINDAANGVFLPGTAKPILSQCAGAYHRKIHKAGYFERLRIELTAAVAKNGCAGVRPALRKFGEKLQMSPREINLNAPPWGASEPAFNPIETGRSSSFAGPEALPNEPPGGLR